MLKKKYNNAEEEEIVLQGLFGTKKKVHVLLTKKLKKKGRKKH